MKYFVLCLLLASVGSAQTRPRPADDSVKQVNMQGRVREVSNRDISIELKDNRIVTFKVTASTHFNDGLSIKLVQGGDRLIIQGLQDRDDNITAIEVSLDAAGMAADAIAARRPRAVEDAPVATQRPPAKGPDDSDRPILRRGKPAARSTASSDDTAQVADNAPRDSSLKGVRDRPVDEPASASTGAEARTYPVSRPTNLNPKQELIERAREYALSFTDNLPNYVCQQYTTRYQRSPAAKSGMPWMWCPRTWFTRMARKITGTSPSTASP